jgi:hypothetical protein
MDVVYRGSNVVESGCWMDKWWSKTRLWQHKMNRCGEKVDGLCGILREFNWVCQLILYTVKKASSYIAGAADYGTTPRCWNIPAT